MTSLSPIGILAGTAAGPSFNGAAAGAPASGEGSFFAMLGAAQDQQPASEDATQDWQSGQPASNDARNDHPAPAGKKDDPAANAAVLPWTLPQTATVHTAPLPWKLSLNLFGPKSGNPKSETKENHPGASGAAESAAIPLALAMPEGSLVSATTARESKSVPGIKPDTSQNNIEAEQTQSASASQLAFALRLTSDGQQPNAQNSANNGKPSEAAGSPIAAIETAQGSAAASADANADTHHDANRQGDTGSPDDMALAAPAAASSASFQSAAHAVAADAPPAPAAPAPTDTSASAPQPTAHTHAIANSEPAARTGTANDLTFSVSGKDQQKVEVRVMDRAGEVRVSVRTPNEELANTLRTDLGSLTGKLNQSGFATEAFAPASHSGSFSREQNSSTSDQQQQSPGQDRNSNRQGQSQGSQQDGRGKRPSWLDELETAGSSSTKGNS